MKDHPSIYVLVGFGKSLIDFYIWNKEFEKEHRGTKPPKEILDDRLLKSARAGKPRSAGYFKTVKKVEAYIKKFPGCVADGQNRIICLEKWYLNTVNEADQDFEVLWWELQEDYTYIKIEQPDWAKGTCNFAE